jgi:uncharacterized membrane protein required for colicin V production
MLTHFFNSINWVDVALAVLLIRVIFISVKTGFVTEVFKFSGVLFALFVSLHYYSRLAALAAQKTSLPLASWELIIFLALWGLIVLVFKFLRDGIMLVFKVETTHQGLDQYAGGLLGAGRAIFLVSLTLFALLLVSHPYLHRQAVAAGGYKIAAKAAPNTYDFLFHHLIGKLFEGEKFNAEVFAVVGGHGTHPK